MTSTRGLPAKGGSTPGSAGSGRAGLSGTEAGLRLIREGPNALPLARGHGLLAIAWEPMFLLLVGAGGLYLAMGSLGDAAILLGFVFVVMGITIIQERRTERALDALRDLSSPRALVIRDGAQRRIPAGELVHGDLVMLAEGDRVPADGLLREATGLWVDESLLTGESVPVPKSASAEAQAMDHPGGDHLPSVFSGTLVTSGQGLAQVLATGQRSEIGSIGKALGQLKPERSRLQQETGRLVRIMTAIALALCAIVVVAYALIHGADAASWKQGLLSGITLAMATIPEELPVILTVFLALGAWRISLHRVLTRRMPAIEDLGAATVLCTDKTGTLTRNQMSVARVVLDGQRSDLDPPPDGPPPARAPEVQALLELAALASKVDPFDPMEGAIHVASRAAAPATGPQRPGWSVVREYPLTPGLLACTQVWDPGAGEPLLLAAKGAPEAIADLCGLPPMAGEALAHQVTILAGEGLRVLGVAEGRTTAERLPDDQADLDLEFRGLIALADPLRANVPAAVAECRSAGIRVLMITGDYPATAQSIARQAGIADPQVFISGAELSAMSDAELARRIGTVQVFARVAPEQKLRIVEALKANHEVVAMTGDGVNDAPALKAAQIGIAMGGRGTDVARESAALVLLDDDFASIVAAARMGRRIFDNIRKAVVFTIAVHVPIAGLSLLSVFMPGWPLLLLPVHIVFLELVIDPACSLVFEAEPAERDIMERPPRNSRERLFSWQGAAMSLLQGFGVLAVCSGIFLAAWDDQGAEAARAQTFTVLVAAIVGIIITNRSWSLPVFAILRIPNAAQWWVVLGAIGLLALVLTLPAVRAFFHFAPLHGPDLLLGLGALVLCVAWFEALKLLRRRWLYQRRT